MQQRWDTGPGEGWTCWVAVDYHKVHNSVSYPMLRAPLHYIWIPPAWIHVPT